MILESEKNPPINNPTSKNIKNTIRKLRSYGPSSYASLTDDSGNYLQVAGGGITCMLEWRDATHHHHYRAHLENPSKVFPDGTILSFSGGEIPLRADEWITASIVERAFESFLKKEIFPTELKWRDISHLFENSKP